MQVANTAHSDFLRVRRKAFWRGIAKWLLRSDDALLAFDDVRKQLHAHLQHDGGMREVPIDQIVGSVGRYRDFDRAFLPRQARTRGRWESIDTAYLTHVELPPIELYKIGETYFVKDGNHRVSVARERGQVFVDASVADRAHRVLGTKPLEPRPPSAFARLAVALLVAALVLGLVAIVVTIAR